MRKGLTIFLASALLFAVFGCAGLDVDNTSASNNLHELEVESEVVFDPPPEPTPEQTPDTTTEQFEDVEEDNVNEVTRGSIVPGMWKFDDEGSPWELSDSMLFIRPDGTFEVDLYYTTATGILRCTNQDPPLWTSDATMMGGEGNPNHTETRSVTIAFDKDTSGLTLSISGMDIIYKYRLVEIWCDA
jgi:hypothetical protein